MRILFLLVFFAALAGGGWWWYATKHAPPDEPRILETQVVGRGTVREVIEATGIVKPQVGAQIQIGAQATGRIQEMLVRVGDQVRQGDRIAVIDDRELKAQRQKALADLEKGRTALRFARTDHDRQRRLFRDGVIAQEALDEAVERLESAMDEVASLEAAVRILDVKLTYTEIRSPISGVVSEVTAQAGETVVSGLEVANLVTVLDPERLEMWVYMDETDVGQARPGQPVEFQVDSLPERVFESSIENIYPKPEIRDNIVYYLAVAPLSREQAALLRPEMTTQCRVVVAEKRDVLTLPNAALKWVGGEMVVFVRDAPGAEATEPPPPQSWRWDFWNRQERTPGRQVRTVRPELGLRGITHSEVISGLREGEEVATQVVLPQTDKRPGMGRGGGP